MDSAAIEGIIDLNKNQEMKRFAVNTALTSEPMMLF